VQENIGRTRQRGRLFGPDKHQGKAGCDEGQDRRHVRLLDRRCLLVRVRVTQGGALLIGLRTIGHRLACAVEHWRARGRYQVGTGVSRHGQLHEQQAQQRNDCAHEAVSTGIFHGVGIQPPLYGPNGKLWKPRLPGPTPKQPCGLSPDLPQTVTSAAGFSLFEQPKPVEDDEQARVYNAVISRAAAIFAERAEDVSFLTLPHQSGRKQQ
jgi:hypothetical protein